MEGDSSSSSELSSSSSYDSEAHRSASSGSSSSSSSSDLERDVPSSADRGGRLGGLGNSERASAEGGSPGGSKKVVAGESDSSDSSSDVGSSELDSDPDDEGKEVASSRRVNSTDESSNDSDSDSGADSGDRSSSSSSSSSSYSSESSSGGTPEAQLARERLRRRQAQKTIRDLLTNVGQYKQMVEAEKAELVAEVDLHRARSTEAESKVAQLEVAASAAAQEMRVRQRENMENLQTLLKEMTLIEEASTEATDLLEAERAARAATEAQLLEAAEVNEALQLKVERAHREMKRIKRQSRKNLAAAANAESGSDGSGFLEGDAEESLEKQVIKLRKSLAVERDRLKQVDEFLSRARSAAGVSQRHHKRSDGVQDREIVLNEEIQRREEVQQQLDAKEQELAQQRDSDAKKIAQLEKRVKDLLHSHTTTLARASQFGGPGIGAAASSVSVSAVATVSDDGKKGGIFSRRRSKTGRRTSVASTVSGQDGSKASADSSESTDEAPEPVSEPGNFQQNMVILDPIKGLITVPSDSPEARAAGEATAAGQVAPQLAAAFAERGGSRRATFSPQLVRQTPDLPSPSPPSSKKGDRPASVRSSLKKGAAIAEPEGFRSNSLVIDKRTGELVVLTPGEKMQDYHTTVEDADDAVGASSESPSKVRSSATLKSSPRPRSGKKKPRKTRVKAETMRGRQSLVLSSSSPNLFSTDDSAVSVTARKMTARFTPDGEEARYWPFDLRGNTISELRRTLATTLKIREHLIQDIVDVSGGGSSVKTDADVFKLPADTLLEVAAREKGEGSVSMRDRRARTELFDRRQLQTSLDEEGARATTSPRAQSTWTKLDIEVPSPNKKGVVARTVWLADGEIKSKNPEQRLSTLSLRSSTSSNLVTRADRRKLRHIVVIQRTWRAYSARRALADRRMFLWTARAHVLEQLIVGEQEFREGLSIVKNHFALPIAKQKLLSKGKQQDLFVNVDSLLAVSISLLASLRTLQDEFADPSDVRLHLPLFVNSLAEAFEAVFFPHTDKFIGQASTLSEALATLDTKGAASAFARLQSSPNKGADLDSLGRFPDLLRAPANHVSSTVFLLDKLVNCTMPDSAERQKLEMVQGVVRQVDVEARRAREQSARELHVSRVEKFLTNSGGLGKLLRRDMHDRERNFIREGQLLKVCRKDTKNRLFVLFSDCILYADCDGYSASHGFGPGWNRKKAKLHRAVWLSSQCRVEEKMEDRVDNRASKFGLDIVTPKKSFSCYASSESERDAWIEDIRLAIQSTASAHQAINDETTKSDAAAPVWVPDSDVKACQVCARKFTAIRRRHHCRKCGQCICAKCWTNTMLVGRKQKRVCDTCAGIQTKGRQKQRPSSLILSALDGAEQELLDGSQLAALQHLALSRPSLRPHPSEGRIGSETGDTETPVSDFVPYWEVRLDRMSIQDAKNKLRAATAIQGQLLATDTPIRGLSASVLARIVAFALVDVSAEVPEELGRALRQFSLVAKIWREAVSSDYVWKDAFQRMWPDSFASYEQTCVSVCSSLPRSASLNPHSDPVLAVSAGLDHRWRDRFLSETAWDSETHPRSIQVSGHEGLVTCVSLHLMEVNPKEWSKLVKQFPGRNPDGRPTRAHPPRTENILITGSMDTNLIVWSLRSTRKAGRHILKSAKSLRTLMCTRAIRCVWASPVHNVIIAGGDEKVARMWPFWGSEDDETPARLWASSPVTSILGGFSVATRSPDMVVAAGTSSGEIVLFDSTRWKVLVDEGRLRGHAGAVTCLSSASAGRNMTHSLRPLPEDGMADILVDVLVSGGADHTIRVWDLTSRRCTSVLDTTASSPLRSLQYDGTIGRIVCGDDSGKVHVVSLQGAGDWSCQAHTAAADNDSKGASLRGLQFDSSKIVTGGSDGTIHVWDWPGLGGDGENRTLVPRTTLRNPSSSASDAEETVSGLQFTGSVLAAAVGNAAVLWTF